MTDFKALHWTNTANLEWVQSAVDYSNDATIQNAWSEMKADGRQLRSAVDYLMAENASLKQENANLKDVIAAPGKPRYAQLLGENASLKSALAQAGADIASERERRTIAQEAITLKYIPEIAALREQLAAKERE